MDIVVSSYSQLVFSEKVRPIIAEERTESQEQNLDDTTQNIIAEYSEVKNLLYQNFVDGFHSKAFQEIIHSEENNQDRYNPNSKSVRDIKGLSFQFRKLVYQTPQ